jgi:hypothetical protein
MDWGQMAVFLYIAALTHFFADLLSHRWKRGRLVYLHCFLYAALFTPLLWWFGTSLWWLVFIFLSHLIIDRPARKYVIAIARVFAKDQLNVVAFGLDQALHLSAPLIIAFFVFG